VAGILEACVDPARSGVLILDPAATGEVTCDRQRRTLGNLLGNALDSGRWVQAQAIAQPLNEYWDAVGLREEARGWVDRARLALETAGGTPPPVDGPAEALWRFVIISQANRELVAHHFDAVERAYLDIRDMLQAQPESPKQLQELATTHHHLGMVAHRRGRFDDAEHCTTKPSPSTRNSATCAAWPTPSPGTADPSSSTRSSATKPA
jgi:hypothetical protein